VDRIVAQVFAFVGSHGVNYGDSARDIKGSQEHNLGSFRNWPTETKHVNELAPVPQIVAPLGG
jgi:hypothetical protein